MKIELPPDVEASCRELVVFWGWDNTDANAADCAIGLLKEALWETREEIRETGRQPTPPRQHQVIPDACALENSTLADLGVDPSRLAPIVRDTKEGK